MANGRNFLLTLALTVLTSFSAAPARAETVMVKSITYFAVGGRTAAELDKALSSAGPMMKETGARHPGATRIKFGGSVTYAKSGNRCAVSNAKVTLNTRLILPRWSNRAKAGADLAVVWDTLSSDIKRHEERHAEIARNHARMMEKALLNLPAEANCERMQASVARASETAIEAHDKDQAAFDVREAVNFDRRMVRLLQYKLETIRKSQSRP